MKTGCLNVGHWGADGEIATIIRVCPYCGYSDWLGEGPDHKWWGFIDEPDLFDTVKWCGAVDGCDYYIQSKQEICEQLAFRDDEDSRLLLKLIDEIGAKRKGQE